jgi:hypothetical protein
MPIAIRSLALITLATTLVACSSKPADTASSPGAASAPAATASGASAASGDYHGVAIYPGLVQLTTSDIPAGEGMTMHSGSFRSSDPADKILAFYRDALTKMFGAVGDMPGSGDGGMFRIASGNEKDKMVTILVHPGESGGQIIGIQLVSKD